MRPVRWICGWRSSTGWIAPELAAKLVRMNARVDQLLTEVLALAPEERSALALALLDSLDTADEAAVSKAWEEEVHRRKAELRSGLADPIPWAESRARLRAL